MIIIMGHVSLAPSDVTEFLADIQVIGPLTKAEKGCLFYAVALKTQALGACWLLNAGKIRNH